MAKSFNPVYVYPTEKTGFFFGKKSGEKRVKDIKDADHDAYGGWWPSFFPTAVGFLVTGTFERPNVMTVACMVVVNAYPFMIGIPVFAGGKSERGDGPRYSLELMRENPEFTLNVPYIDPQMTKRILICGSLSGRSGIDKIARAGFTPLPSRHLAPPILKECPLNLECRIHSQELLGSHYWTIGRVEAVHLDDRLADGSDQLIWRSLPELVRGGVDSGKGGN